MHYRNLRPYCLLILLQALFFCSLTSPANAKFSTLRDTEIELFIKDVSESLLLAADVAPPTVRFYIVQDKSINAFVFGGSNIFINSGLLRFSDKPDVLIGVLAHEIAHISQGHILSMHQEHKQTLINTSLTYALGIAAAIAGSAEAASAIIAGGNHIAHRQLLSHSRTNEQEADQIALKILNQLKLPVDGLVALFEHLSREDITRNDSINPYARTHPLSRERISFLKHAQTNQEGKNYSIDPQISHRFQLIYAKISAYLDNYDQTLARYPLSDHSEAAQYARAVAYFKKPDIQQSLLIMDDLIRDHPENPYYHEMKGQILYETGSGKDALVHYEQANRLLPRSPLILLQLARIHILYETKEHYQQAITYLNQGLSLEPNNPGIFRQLAIAHGRLGEIAYSNLYLTEQHFLMNDKKTAKKFLHTALEHLEKDTPAYLRALDLKKLLDKKQD